MGELGRRERSDGSCRVGGKPAKARYQTRTAASTSGPEFAVKLGKEYRELGRMRELGWVRAQSQRLC